MLNRLLILDFNPTNFRDIFNDVKTYSGVERMLFQIEPNIIIMYFEYDGDLDAMMTHLKSESGILSFCNYIFLDKYIEGNNFALIPSSFTEHFYNGSLDVINEIEKFLIDLGGGDSDEELNFDFDGDILIYDEDKRQGYQYKPSVDDILDKISEFGVDSLTESDKNILKNLNY